MKRLFALLALLGATGARPALGAEPEMDLVIAPRQNPGNLSSPDSAALQAGLRSPDFAQAQAAAEQLAASRNARAPEFLWTLYNGGDAQRRLLAVRCVGRSGQPGQEDNLLRVALWDRYQAIRLAAAAELARLATADKAAALLAKAAADEKGLAPLSRLRALQALAEVKGKGTVECLRAWAGGPPSDMAVAAVEGLGRLGDQAQAEALVSALSTSDAELKPAAADALEYLTGRSYRYDLVKWTEWLKERPAPPPAPRAAAATDSGSLRDSNSAAAAPREEGWDVVVVFDTTGSMVHIWPLLHPAIDAVAAELARQAPALRLGAVRYRAALPQQSLAYLVKARPLTRKHDEIREDLKDASFGGGSGGLHLGLAYAIKAMPWRVAARKMIVLVGDTSPLPEAVRACAQMIQEARQLDGILTNVVYVRSGHGSQHAEVYRGLALHGAGRYHEYDKAEKRLVDRTEEARGSREPEPPAETAAKWLTPRQ